MWLSKNLLHWKNCLNFTILWNAECIELLTQGRIRDLGKGGSRGLGSSHVAFQKPVALGELFKLHHSLECYEASLVPPETDMYILRGEVFILKGEVFILKGMYIFCREIYIF